MSNGFIRLCSMVFCWAAINACHAMLSSHMTNKDDDDDNTDPASISDECSVLMIKKCLSYSIYCDIPLFHVC